MSDAANDPWAQVELEIAQLRERVTGVRGCLVAGVDGILLLCDGATGPEPQDLAALAAASYGIGHSTGVALHHGNHLESTIHSSGGYFTIYSVDANTLLAVIGEAGMNVARLHLEAKASVPRLAEAIRLGSEQMAAARPRL